MTGASVLRWASLLAASHSLLMYRVEVAGLRQQEKTLEEVEHADAVHEEPEMRMQSRAPSALIESVVLGKGGFRLRFRVAAGEKNFLLRLMTRERVLEDTGAAASSWRATGVHEEAPPGQEGIPNKVFLTGPWRPEEIIEKNKEHFADGTEFLFYDDSGMAESMKAIGGELAERGLVADVADAWAMLRAMAFRADLWRLAVIWKYGGIYLDSKVVLTKPPSSFVDMAADQMAICHDAGAVFGLWNGLFAARRGEPALVTVMQAIVATVQSRAYPSVLGITGPVAWYKALEKRAKDAPSWGRVPTVRCIFRDGRLRVACNGDFVLAPLGGAVIKGGAACAEEDKELAHVDEKEHAVEHSHRDWYAALWSKHAVYCDEAYEGEDDICKAHGGGALGLLWGGLWGGLWRGLWGGHWGVGFVALGVALGLAFRVVTFRAADDVCDAQGCGAAPSSQARSR